MTAGEAAEAGGVTEAGGRPLRVGIIGAGWIGLRHAQTLAARGDVQVAAICDLDADRAAAVAADTGSGGTQVFTDWRQMLDDAAPDAVWVCTPPRVHLDPAVTVLERGIPLYLEKPIARTLDDAAQIVAAADRAAGSGVACAVGYQWHALDVLDDLRGCLAGQDVGCLVGQSVGGTESRPWFLDRAAGGGNLLERGSHHIDLARTVAGEVVAVQAAGSSVRLAPRAGAAGDIDDAVTLLLHFAGGGLGTIVVAWTSDDLPGSYWLEVTAARASLRLDLDPDFRLSGVSDGAAVAVSSRADPFARSLDRFIGAARARKPGAVFCTPANALGTLAVAVAAEEALATGHTVPVSER